MPIYRARPSNWKVWKHFPLCSTKVFLHGAIRMMLMYGKFSISPLKVDFSQFFKSSPLKVGCHGIIAIALLMYGVRWGALFLCFEMTTAYIYRWWWKDYNLCWCRAWKELKSILDMLATRTSCAPGTLSPLRLLKCSPSTLYRWDKTWRNRNLIVIT